MVPVISKDESRSFELKGTLNRHPFVSWMLPPPLPSLQDNPAHKLSSVLFVPSALHTLPHGAPLKNAFALQAPCDPPMTHILRGRSNQPPSHPIECPALPHATKLVLLSHYRLANIRVPIREG